jgi:putative DNA primase/helicase
MRGVIDAAKGKWHGILPQFGIDTRYLNKQRGPCPICGGKDRYFWDNKEGRGTFFCNQCGAGSGVQLVAMFKNWSIRETIKEIERVVGTVEYKQPEPEQTDQQKKDALNKTWSGAQAVREGDPVSTYLTNRTGRHWPSNAVRYHAELWHPEEKKTFPAMVAKVTDIENKPVSIHRTFLDKSGNKAKITKAKMVMSSTIPEGSAIRLMPYDHIIGIAEGIETAYSAAAIFSVPVWAAISAGIMAKWKPPAMVEKVVIFGDNDHNFVGQSAAYRLAFTLRKEYGEDLDITVAIPSIRGADWNDVYQIHGIETAVKEAAIICPTAFRTLPVG